MVITYNKVMITPNWQHHSKKEQKRTLRPQALRQARARRTALLRTIARMAESVDAPDLKSVDCKNREGSSPSSRMFIVK